MHILRITKHIKVWALLIKNQHGFCEETSCLTSLLEIFKFVNSMWKGRIHRESRETSTPSPRNLLLCSAAVCTTAVGLGTFHAAYVYLFWAMLSVLHFPWSNWLLEDFLAHAATMAMWERWDGLHIHASFLFLDIIILLVVHRICSLLHWCYSGGFFCSH